MKRTYYITGYHDNHSDCEIEELKYTRYLDIRVKGQCFGRDCFKKMVFSAICISSQEGYINQKSENGLCLRHNPTLIFKFTANSNDEAEKVFKAWLVADKL